MHIVQIYCIVIRMSELRESTEVPRLWSDFDGTVVELARWYNYRNWTKYPLAGIAGYIDFLRGAQSQDVDISGIVSARPNNFQRRRATRRTIADLGLDEFFDDYNTLLKGSHGAKAEVIARESEKVPVGMLEDLPEKLLPPLVRAMILRKDRHTYPVTLGIVNSAANTPYIHQSLEVFGQAPDFDITATEGYYAVTGQDFSLRFVPIDTYSTQSGVDFAKRLR